LQEILGQLSGRHVVTASPQTRHSGPRDLEVAWRGMVLNRATPGAMLWQHQQSETIFGHICLKTF